MTDPIRYTNPSSDSTPSPLGSDPRSIELDKRTREIVSELVQSKPSHHDALHFIKDIDSAQIELQKEDEDDQKNQQNALNLDVSHSVDDIINASVFGNTIV